MLDSLASNTSASRRSARLNSYAVVRRAVVLYARVDLAFDRARQALASSVEGFLGHALTAEEKAELTIALYAARAGQSDAGLTRWEERWYAEALPPAPARLLLAAAGAGRELLPLCAAGYTVSAFEPAEQPAALLAKLASARAEVARGSFADLVSAVLDGQSNTLSELGRRRYDAVILGWGSFTHVLEAEAQRALLRACDRLAGTGPVLVSFWSARESEPRSRARALGATLGRALASARGSASSMPPGQTFRTHCGFAHQFTRTEIEALAADCGRRARWGTEGYPHVTLVTEA